MRSSRARGRPTAATRPAAAAPRPGAQGGPIAAYALTLQRSAGNGAVARVLAARGGAAYAPLLQRSPTSKPQEAGGEHTHVDPDYPGLQLTKDDASDHLGFDNQNEGIYRRQDGAYVVFSESRYLALTEQQLAALKGGEPDWDIQDLPQADMRAWATPAPNTPPGSYYFGQRELAFGGVVSDYGPLETLVADQQPNHRCGTVMLSLAFLSQEVQLRADVQSGNASQESRTQDVVTGIGSGAVIPPIDITYRAGSRQIGLAQGNHRIVASLRAHRETIPATVISG